MYIYIHILRNGLEEQVVGRIRAFRNQLVVSFHYSLVKIRRAEISAVDEEELIAGTAASILRIADEA